MAQITLTVQLSESELKDANIATARQAGLAAVNDAAALKAATCATNYTPQAGTFVFDLSPPAAGGGDGGAANPPAAAGDTSAANQPAGGGAAAAAAK